MRDSYIKTNKNGTQTLIVFYNNEKGDFDEMTELALQKHGLPENNKLNIICLPKHGTRTSGKTDKQGFTGGADDK